jgi:adenylate kinase
MNLVILGPPGAGKGTICNSIISEYNYNLICAGDLLRAEKASGSKLGEKIASIIDGGNLVPDEMITTLIVNELRKPVRHKTFYLIDGYPRTKGQAQSLDGMLNIKNVIWINISEETTIKRNLKRGETSGRPDDSNVEVIKERLREYNEVSKPLKQFYKNRLTEIDGEGTPDEVYHELIKNIIK